MRSFAAIASDAHLDFVLTPVRQIATAFFSAKITYDLPELEAREIARVRGVRFRCGPSKTGPRRRKTTQGYGYFSDAEILRRIGELIHDGRREKGKGNRTMGVYKAAEVAVAEAVEAQAKRVVIWNRRFPENPLAASKKLGADAYAARFGRTRDSQKWQS